MVTVPLFWRLIGVVKVRVQSSNPARFLNLCVSSGLPVSGIQEEDGHLVFYMLPWRYSELRPIARKTGSRPRVAARAGLWFMWLKAIKRKALVATFLAVSGVLYYMSGSIWAVEVRGNTRVTSERILAAAVKAGLYRGVRKSSVSTELIDSSIARDIPELGWVYTSIHGTVALIQVREKLTHPVETPGDIVAKRDGIVKSVLVLAGQPLVKAGDTVKGGDLLIAGDPSASSGGARGEVVAITWYKVAVDVPLREVRPRRTGRHVELPLLRLGGQLVPLFGFRDIPFRWYEVEEEGTGAGEDRTGLIVTRTYYELDWEEVERTVEEARDLARKRLADTLRRQLPPSVKLVDSNTEVTVAPDRTVVRGVALVTAEENIALVRPWPRETGDETR